MPVDLAKKKRIFILDPMLASGGSCACCISKLKELGVEEERITFINLISCPYGIEKLLKEHPKIKIITAAIDEKLNEKKYIVPGLGDFGDRYFNTVSYCD